MQRTTTLRGGFLLATALVAGVAAAFYATRSSGATAQRSRAVVMTANNETLHERILVNRRGMTLYSLSVERHGKFVCTNAACLAVWKPLTVAKGTKPTGVARLSTVRRPDGRTHVAYRGEPLYSFTGDHKRGDVNGNGFKDVGTWRVVAVGKSSSPVPAPAPAPTTTTPYPY